MHDLSEELKPEALNHARKEIWWWSGVLCFVLVFAWPLLTLPAGVFSQVCCFSFLLSVTAKHANASNILLLEASTPACVTAMQ